MLTKDHSILTVALRSHCRSEGTSFNISLKLWQNCFMLYCWSGGRCRQGVPWMVEESGPWRCEFSSSHILAANLGSLPNLPYPYYNHLIDYCEKTQSSALKYCPHHSRSNSRSNLCRNTATLWGSGWLTSVCHSNFPCPLLSFTSAFVTHLHPAVCSVPLCDICAPAVPSPLLGLLP